jgi:methyltransferase (TIGR00027 family)
VCAGRAIAHGAPWAGRFSDPAAMALLPDDARARVERYRAGVVPPGLGGRLQHAYLGRQAMLMAVRTVAIDDAVRAAASPQLVILGAGLDGRAFRMAELRDVVAFEVDHPDSQREKRARAAALTPTARELRYVPVDFARDDLDAGLAAAGHDPARPTTWIWEGVVMYLARAAIEATLAVVARRSAPRSRLVVLYHSPALIRPIVGFFVRRIGEPLRSVFRPAAMRALLARYGFEVVHDDDLPTIGAAMSPELGRGTRPIKHLRIATADSRGDGRR